MIARRICTLLAALTFPATLLVTQAPAAQAADGPCPDYMTLQGDTMAIRTREGRWLGEGRAKFNHSTKYWCLEVLGYTATVKGKYNGDIGYRASDTGSDGMVHVWLAPNFERGCVWIHGSIDSPNGSGYNTRMRCHA